MTVRDTSIQTYYDIINEGLVGEKQTEVLKWISENPNHTDTEIAKGLGYADINKTRPRRKELVDLDVVESNGKKDCSHTGRQCYVWRLKEQLPSIDQIRINKERIRMQCPMCEGKGYIQNGQQKLSF